MLTQAANARQEPFVCQRSDSVSQTDGTWHWQTYPNGDVHLTAKIAKNVTGGTAWGSIYYDSAPVGGYTYPIILKEVYSGTVSIVGANGTFWPLLIDSGTTTTAPKAYAARATKGTSAANINLVFDVWGRI